MDSPITAPPTSSPAKWERILTSLVVTLILLVALESVTGILTFLQYRADAGAAYQSTKEISPYLRAIHYWTSGCLILLSAVAMFWMAALRWFRMHPAIWLGTVLVLIGSFLSQMSGNLLPFDRHGVQTAVVEAGISHSAPFAGGWVAKMMLGGDGFSARTLTIWAAAHFYIFGLVAVAAAILLAISLRRVNLSPSRALPAVLVLGALILAGAVSAPLGQPASLSDFNSFDARVSWYTWPLHGMLNMFNRVGAGWIGAILIPTLFIGLLVLSTLVRKKQMEAGASWTIFLFGALFLVAGVAFGGQFAPLTGNRDPKVFQVSKNDHSPQDTQLVARGKELFNNFCSSCHGQDGVKGGIGPVLKGIASRRGSDTQWYISFIKAPTSMKSSSTMPAFGQLKEEELRSIAEFLIANR